MKIENLEMKDFRNHEESLMVFDQVNFIIGKNNSGKSAVKAALQTALTGSNEWANSNQALKELIRQGADQTSIELEVDQLGLVRRTIKKSKNEVFLNSSLLPEKELVEEYREELGIDYDPLMAVLHSYQFLNMKPNDQKEFIFKISGTNLDINVVLGAMNDPSDAAKDYVEAMLKNVKALDFEAFDEISKELREERKVAKKELATVKAKRENTVIPPEPAKPLDDVKEAMKEQKDIRDKAMKEMASNDQKAKHKKKMEEKKDTLTEKLERLKKQKVSSLSIAQAEESIMDLVSQINTLDEIIQESTSRGLVMKEQNQELEKIIGKLDTDTCPISDKLKCTTDKSPVKNDLQKQVDLNKQQMEKERETIQKNKDDKNETVKKKEEREKHIKLMTEVEWVEEQLKEIQTELKGIKLKDNTNLKKKVEETDQEIEKLDQLLESWKVYAQAKKESQQLEKEEEKKKNEVEVLEYLVKEFGPDGVKNRVLRQIVGPLEDHCNEMLNKLTSNRYQLKFDFGKKFQILVTNFNGTISVNNLSHSERLRIALILQDAVNKLTGVGILMLDDAEVLDEDNRELLLDFLSIVRDDYDSIFVSMTHENKQSDFVKRLKNIPSSKVFFVKEGAVEEV